MLKTVANLLKNKETRNRILFTLGALFIFRLGATITVPFVNVLNQGSLGANQGFLDLVNLLGGGSIERFSLFALGIGPYITASIIIQLLSMDVIPHLTELSKEGQNGKRKLDRYTRILGVILSFIQAFVMVKFVFGAEHQVLVNNSLPVFLYVATILTGGTMFLLWLGDQISAKGIGNGISMIIFAGIVSNYPTIIYGMWSQTVNTGSNQEIFQGVLAFAGLMLIFVALIALVVFMSVAVRKIPIQYTSSAVVQKRSDMTFLPLKINSASVIPVIFASALMTAPIAIVNLLNVQNSFANGMRQFLDFSKPQGLVIYGVLIVLFTFFYTNLQVDPEKIAENLSKNGTYIPGVRPGKETKNYVAMVLNRITVLGALSLLFIALLPFVLPMIIPGLPNGFGISGTGLIIVVGVALETSNQLKGQITQKSYSGFLSR